LSATRVGLALNRRYTVKGTYTDSSGALIGPATALTWTSDNPQVAAVGDDGTITAASYGHARVVAGAPGGNRAQVEVFVQGEIVIASSRTGKFQLYSAERSNLTQWRKLAEDTMTAT